MGRVMSFERDIVDLGWLTCRPRKVCLCTLDVVVQERTVVRSKLYSAIKITSAKVA